MQHFWIRAEAAIVCVIRVVGLLRPSVQLSGGQLAIPPVEALHQGDEAITGVLSH